MQARAGLDLELDADTAPARRQTIGHMETVLAGKSREGGQRTARARLRASVL